MYSIMNKSCTCMCDELENSCWRSQREKKKKNIPSFSLLRTGFVAVRVQHSWLMSIHERTASTQCTPWIKSLCKTSSHILTYWHSGLFFKLKHEYFPKRWSREARITMPPSSQTRRNYICILPTTGRPQLNWSQTGGSLGKRLAEKKKTRAKGRKNKQRRE